MRLTEEQKRSLDGEKGVILQLAMAYHIKYGAAMGAEEFIPISSAYTFFFSPRAGAQYFPPRHVQLSDEHIGRFCKKLAEIQVRAKNTIDPQAIDLEKWLQMSGSEATYNSLKKAVELCRKCGILANWTCIPYIEAYTPVMGEHCSWSESSALIYANSIPGAKTNRDRGEASFFSAILGITPNFVLQLDENRKGAHLIDVQCQINTITDWGALGYFAGEAANTGIPVFTNLRTPSVEDAKQLGAAINVPGGAVMFHIVGVTPEVTTIEAAFLGGGYPKGNICLR